MRRRRIKSGFICFDSQHAIKSGVVGRDGTHFLYGLDDTFGVECFILHLHNGGSFEILFKIT